MNLNSQSASKRIRTETYTAIESTGNIQDIPVSAPAASKVTISEDANNTFINVFLEDILPEIFDNLDILTTRDLLNFRLVNRCWRNAATLILLKRNLVRIDLDFDEFAFDEKGNAVTQIRQGTVRDNDNFENTKRACRFFNLHQPTNYVADLSALISTSSKFPSASIGFHMVGTSGSQSVSYDITTYESDDQDADPHRNDLLHFFSLYGKKIKELSLSSGISGQSIHDLLFVHLPHLTCVDLQKFDYGRHPYWESSHIPICDPLPSTLLQLKEIKLERDMRFGNNISSFVKDLIRVSPNLSSIKSVNVTALRLLLEIGKSHLVTELHFRPTNSQLGTIRQFAKLLVNMILEEQLRNMKLSKLTVVLDQEFYDKDPIVVKVLNIILSASKDSLRYLQLDIAPPLKILFNKMYDIFIPPLPHLKYLGLHDSELEKSLTPTLQFHFSDVIRRVIEDGDVTADDSMYDLTSFHFLIANGENQIIPADYFPRLRQVNLVMKKIRSNTRKLMEFFSLQHLGPEDTIPVPGDTLWTVTYLEWHKFPLYDRNLSKLFPNVSDFKIHCEDAISLRNWFWIDFPKLERFEIFGLRSSWKTNVVDSFFTGLAPELCANLESADLESAPALGFKRTQPYIGDCTNLKELKINVGRNWRFASQVTDVYGFGKVVHRTKIIFSFKNCFIKMSANEIQETKQDVELILPYVKSTFR